MDVDWLVGYFAERGGRSLPFATSSLECRDTIPTVASEIPPYFGKVQMVSDSLISPFLSREMREDSFCLQVQGSITYLLLRYYNNGLIR